MAEGRGPVPQPGRRPDPAHVASDGFDFLYLNIHRYRTSQGSKALTAQPR